MKTMVLKQANGYPILLAFMESNSFGAQIINIKHAFLKDADKDQCHTFHEGEHIEWTQKRLIQLYTKGY